MLEKQRTISRYDKFLLYFKTGTFFIGEACVLAGIVCLSKFFLTFEVEFLIGVLAFVPAYFIIKGKVNNLISGTRAIEQGEKTITQVFSIENTYFQHNKRTVKEYTFQFLVNGKTFNYTFCSAYHRHLEIGTELEIYYLAEDPNISVVPSLFGIKISDN